MRCLPVVVGFSGSRFGLRHEIGFALLFGFALLLLAVVLFLLAREVKIALHDLKHDG